MIGFFLASNWFLATVGTSLKMDEMMMMMGPIAWPMWTFIFVSGMMTYRIFETSRRGLKPGEGSQRWGLVADGVTLLYVLTLLAPVFLWVSPFDSSSSSALVASALASSDVAASFKA